MIYFINILTINMNIGIIYNIIQIISYSLSIMNNVKLLIKEGGKSGVWTNPDGLPKFLDNIF